jgi:hypothetical protein
MPSSAPSSIIGEDIFQRTGSEGDSCGRNSVSQKDKRAGYQFLEDNRCRYQIKLQPKTAASRHRSLLKSEAPRQYYNTHSQILAPRSSATGTMLSMGSVALVWGQQPEQFVTLLTLSGSPLLTA